MNGTIKLDGKTFMYIPVNPTADTDELADQSQRLMFIHRRDESHLFIASRGTLYSGWVLGTHIVEI